MNEVTFIHQNINQWKEFETALTSNQKTDPDKLSDLYIRLTDDLSYSKTYFKNTETTSYLNSLAQKAHLTVYKAKPINWGIIKRYWLVDFPIVVHKSKKEIGYSFLIFTVSVLIGILSTLYQPDFVRVILGDAYVNMTLENIDKNDPLAVYKSMNQVDMFLGITVNNIKVSFMAFVFGVLTAIGTGYLLVFNGIMLGTFQLFLIQKGFVVESFATIWIHGTLEIFAIIVAGAAGIKMGNSIVFPGTFSRVQSFRNGAISGVKLILGLIPVFIVAGFLEGFVTRYTHAPYTLRFAIIGLSLSFIIYYFFSFSRKVYLKFNTYGTRNN